VGFAGRGVDNLEHGVALDRVGQLELVVDELNDVVGVRRAGDASVLPSTVKGWTIPWATWGRPSGASTRP
jgi:hypothetical protein